MVSAQSLARMLTTVVNNTAAGLPPNGASLFVPGAGFTLAWGSYGATGGSLPSDTHFSKGCLMINYGGNADYNMYCNEGTGYGSAPTWTRVAVLGDPA